MTYEEKKKTMGTVIKKEVRKGFKMWSWGGEGAAAGGEESLMRMKKVNHPDGERRASPHSSPGRPLTRLWR